ncbi:hypothetical protein PQX77_015207 [Marasmius sp. AFHP31]|nr:hypothetical protein PQX77_015207 [Marasmius sp. AFHP31]
MNRRFELGGNGGSVSGSTCAVCGDSSIDEGEKSDAGDVEVEDATRTRAYQWVEVWGESAGARQRMALRMMTRGRKSRWNLMIKLLGAIWWSMLNGCQILRGFGGGRRSARMNMSVGEWCLGCRETEEDNRMFIREGIGKTWMDANTTGAGRSRWDRKPPDVCTTGCDARPAGQHIVRDAVSAASAGLKLI